MSSATSPAMPAFSYAQAAKGLAPSASQSSVKDIQDEPLEQQQTAKPTSKPESQSELQSSQKLSQRHSRSEEKDSKKNVRDDGANATNRDESLDKENHPLSRRGQHKASTPSVSSPNMAADSDGAKDNAVTSANIESLEASGILEKVSNTSDKGKGKENDDDWEKVSIPSSAAAEKELKAAPIPVVNIWQQRKEAQEAKRRELAVQKPAISAPNSAKTSEDHKRKPGHERDLSKAAHKPNERPESNVQSSHPGSRGDKPEAQAVVTDATAWPTPETANIDDRKKSTQGDKPSQNTAGPNSKPHSKWVQMPFVPTAKFETQLPPSAAKRGGRSARGGREGSGRGGHLNNGERVDNSGSMGPPPPPAPRNTEDRGRKNDANRGGRASSLPAQNPRAASRESNAASTRKPSAPVIKDSIPPQAPTAAPFVPASENVTSNVTSQEPSRSSSRQNRTGNNSPKAAETASGQVSEVTADLTAQSASTDATLRQGVTNDRGKPSHGNYRSNEYSRNDRNGPPRNREWSREKSDNAREKVESWRDREYSNDGPSRQSRAERGRGSYRGGRGGSYNPNYQANHSYTSPLPQNGFDMPKSQNEPRSRQSSQPYVQNNAQQGRNPSRAQSIPVSMLYPPQNFYANIPAMQHGMPPLQTDMQGYGMGPHMPLHQGIMSAMPYNESLSSYAVLSLVATQLQYYFSIDNLCKDLFLRKNMDSQGWVLLSVIAGFKRIQQLTEDNQTIKVLRDVLPSLQHDLDYIRGQDGEERIRRKDGWQDFVLPLPERLATAQNDGPVSAVDYSQHQYQQLPHGSGEAMPFVPGQMTSPPTGMNGMYNGQTSPTGYGGVPPYDGMGSNDRPQMPYSARFDHRGSSFGQDSARAASGPHQNGPSMNGHHRTLSRSFTEENVFPDEEIGSVHVLKRELSQVGDDRAMPMIEPVRSNESQGSLRGGIGRKPADQLTVRMQGMKFGSSTPESDSPAIFTKDGQKMRLPDQPPEGYYFQPYFAARAEALQDREHGIDAAMEPMYSFWSTFLVSRFNPAMYNEFKTLAAEDQDRGDERGIKYLIRYYDGALKETLPISAHVAHDLVELLRKETDSSRPIFKLLRLAWRNGALNLKSRKRIQDNLNDEEKAEFDRGG